MILDRPPYWMAPLLGSALDHRQDMHKYAPAIYTSKRCSFILPIVTEGAFVCACLRRTMRGVRELRDFSLKINSKLSYQLI